MSQWNKVTRKTPEEGTPVLVYRCFEEKLSIAIYASGKFWTDYKRKDIDARLRIVDVTHWMKLPYKPCKSLIVNELPDVKAGGEAKILK